MIETIKNLYKKYKEIIDYLFWGVCSTIVSWVTYYIFELIFKNVTEGYVTIASILSWVCAFTFAFFVNKLFVFNSKSWEKSVALKEFVTFLGARAATGVLEVVGVPALVKIGLNYKVFGSEGLIAKILVSVVVVILNYVFSKLIVFKKKKEDN